MNSSCRCNQQIDSVWDEWNYSTSIWMQLYCYIVWSNLLGRGSYNGICIYMGLRCPVYCGKDQQILTFKMAFFLPYIYRPTWIYREISLPPWAKIVGESHLYKTTDATTGHRAVPVKRQHDCWIRLSAAICTARFRLHANIYIVAVVNFRSDWCNHLWSMQQIQASSIPKSAQN